MASPTPTNDLKYRGVRKRKWGKYVSEIRLPNSRERIWLGSYDTAEKAARAFDAALFCLRGRTANFNIPHDPPDIADGHSLSPAQIQVVAQQYANSYAAQPPPDGGDAVDLLDRSFWEMVDINGHNAPAISDFGLFPEPCEMYVHPHFEARVYEYEEDCYDQGNVHASLWNF